jgi:YfiR/HmsC-like
VFHIGTRSSIEEAVHPANSEVAVGSKSTLLETPTVGLRESDVELLTEQRQPLTSSPRRLRGREEPRRDGGNGLPRTHNRRLSCVGFVLVVLLSVGGSNPSAQDGGTEEYQLKAAFLFQFAQFVEWPPETFKSTSDPLTYCTLGEDPFGGALDRSLSGQTVRGRAVRVPHQPIIALTAHAMKGDRVT